MPAALPPEIDVIATPQGERYEMPGRNIGCLKIAAIPLVLIGLVFCFAGLYTSLIEGGVLGAVAGHRGGKPLDPFTALFGVPFFLSGLFTLYLGGMIAGGRSTVELRDGRLIATQRSGPLRWRRKVPIDRIKTFQIKSSGMNEDEVMVGAALSALNVVTTGGRYYNLAWGYPKPMLRTLADRLAQRCGSGGGAKLLDEDRPEIAVEERTVGQDLLPDGELEDIGPGQDADDTVPPQPAGSKVVLTPNDAGLTLTVPAVGIRKAGKGLLGFSIMWNLFIAVFTFFWFYAGVRIGWELLLICGVLSLFWAVGIGTLVAAINAGRRKAILDVVGDTLLVTRQNIFKTRQQEVKRDNIKSILRGASGTKVNGVPILNLQVRLKKGKTISMFSQLSDDELGWIAAVLREALDVPGR
jgi:hypothetical protein